MTTLLIVGLCVAVYGAIVTISNRRAKPAASTVAQPAAPSVEEMAEAMHTADAAVWDRAFVTVDNPMYARHAAVALSLLTSREVTRRG